MKGKIRPITNIYSLVNYEEPSICIIEMADNFDRLMECLQSWDSFRIRRQNSTKQKIITIAPR